MAGGYPWGGITANNTNPFGGGQAPDTGVTRSFNWTIKRAVGAPDGVQRDMILVNDQFPGPSIEANWGDSIQVTVTNLITGPDEGTHIHWHGFLMHDTQTDDGVPGVHQCPIAPGQSYTFNFKAELYGTTWWHAHYSAQYGSGAFGPMTIFGPSNVDYDIDIGAVLLSDNYHRGYFEIVEQVMGVVPIVGGVPNIPAIIPVSDSNLINGRNDYDCSQITDGKSCTPNAPLSEFQFTPGKSHRIRITNAGSDGVQKFSIDQHELLVIANDFTPIIPYTTKFVTLAVGQRADVIVQGLANGTGSYWMRANLTSCAPSANPMAKAIIHYDYSNKLPTSTPWPDTTTDPCATDDLAGLQPWYPITPTKEPDTTVTIDISGTINATGHFVWTMNGSSFRANYNHPTLLLAAAGNTSYPFDPQWNVYNFGSNKTVRFIFNNKSPAAHPMHLHGHNFFVLNAGPGAWDGTIINPENPQRRDTQEVLIGGYLVVQIDMDNPGVWPFHCHIAWHISGGLYINVMERPADIEKIEIDDDVIEVCKGWAAFTDTNLPNEIDSGV
ncbi:MAG: hypothetical protein M1813_005955 [Trichoglossum hirsutum]|nr:MAG: hypothetical protein M1813_005955 [Trichoglossum hirsutum]